MDNLDSESLSSFFLELHRKALILPEEKLYEYFLDYAVKITKSAIGFFHFVGNNQKTIILTTWNKEALKNCSANYDSHYPIEKAGNWADSIRLKHPIIYNEFSKSPNQKGLPEGHVAINRLLTFPIIEESEVRAIFGVGNKTEPYVKNDLVELNLVAGELIKILKLRQSEKRYHQLFSNMDEGFFLGKIIVDKQGRPIDWIFLEANNSFERQSGLNLKDIVGKRVTQVLPKIESGWIETYGKVALTGKSVRFENYNEDTKRWYEVYSYSPENGQFAVIFNNITGRKMVEGKVAAYTKNLEGIIEERTKELALSAIYSRSLIEASLDPLVMINSEGKITDVNKATEIATGCTREELIGSDFSNYFLEPEKAMRGYKRVFTEGVVKDYPLTIKHKNGDIAYVLYNATVYKNEMGEIQGVFAAARDITELKKAEAIALENAKKLKDAERLAAIGATAGMVGHDIRNPLQTITGELYLANSELSNLPNGDTKEKLKESLDIINEQLVYIDKIVADLQDFAKPLTPKLEVVDFKEIAQVVLSSNMVPENIQVEYSISKGFPKLRTDKTYIRRILQNLYANSIQAMPDGGKLTLTATLKRDNAIITVEDTGEGIPMSIRDKMFTPLITTKSKGQGFGLAVVKRMVEALGGKVTFESELRKSTRFIIQLPQKRE